MKFKHPNLSFVAFVVIFVLIIVFGLLGINWPDLTYKRSLEETSATLIDNRDIMYPEDLVGIIEMEDPAYRIIDIRNPYEYIKGHIKSAENLPSNSLLDKDMLSKLEQYAADSLIVVLYGQDQLEANGPWLILKQMGFDNLRVLLGGYGYFTTGPLDIYEMPEVPAYFVEEPAYDFMGIMEEMGSATPQSTAAETETEVVIPVRRKKETVVEGGC